LNAVGDLEKASIVACLWLTKEKRKILETLFENVWMDTLCLPWSDRERLANEPGNARWPAIRLK
jgi:hypothetical protein